jgi:hypothetical protein
VVKLAPCVETQGLSRSQLAALKFHGHLNLINTGSAMQCPWLIMDKRDLASLDLSAKPPFWIFEGTVQHPSDQAETWVLFRRAARTAF